MANSTNTIKTRIQLKSDTEANWRKAVLATDHPNGSKTSGTSFVPLKGELIIFEPDASHSYSRLKVGTGMPSDNVLALPFIDAGTIEGTELPEQQVAIYTSQFYFPQVGSTEKLYVDLATSKIFCYISNTGYSQLSNFTYTTDKVSVSTITDWKTGTATTLTPEAGILKIKTGILPSLYYETRQVVRDITKEGAS